MSSSPSSPPAPPPPVPSRESQPAPVAVRKPSKPHRRSRSSLIHEITELELQFSTEEGDRPELFAPRRVLRGQGTLTVVHTLRANEKLMWFLFNDLLVSATTNARNKFVLRERRPLNGQMSVEDVPDKGSKRHRFKIDDDLLLEAPTADSKAGWMADLRECIDALAHDQLVGVAEDEKLVEGPEWVDFDERRLCQACFKPFQEGRKDHKVHCRACGDVFCRTCTANKAPLEVLGYRSDPQVCCPKCYAVFRPPPPSVPKQ